MRCPILKTDRTPNIFTTIIDRSFKLPAGKKKPTKGLMISSTSDETKPDET